MPLIALGEGGTLIYGNTSGWTVHTDPNAGYHCFAEAQYEGGSSIRVGMDGADGDLYLVLADRSWSSPGAESASGLELRFDDAAPLRFEAKSVDVDSLKISIPDGDRAAFLQAFMASYTMNAQYGDSEVIMLSLGGSMRATRMLQECQTTMASVETTD